MNSLPAIGYFSKFPVQHSANYKPRRFCARIPYIFSALKTSPPPREFSGDEVLQEFLEERGLTGDFISKISDKFWIRELITNSEKQVKAEEMADNFNNATQLV